MKKRLDQYLVEKKFVSSRSQGESYIKLGQIKVNGVKQTKPGFLVGEKDNVVQTTAQQYVSRAALKLASVAEVLNLDFRDKTVLDVGSSTGGFTDFAIRNGANKVIAVEVGTDQLHPSLKGHPKIELHEQTDIRDIKELSSQVDIVVADVSFISLRQILPHVAGLIGPKTLIVAMVKPQFEAGQNSGINNHQAAGSLKHKGVIKNDKMRREILKDFEEWARQKFVIVDKADSAVAGAKGNQERFYLLRKK